MNSAMLTSVCLLVAVSLQSVTAATSYKCYTCDESSVDGAANNCVDGNTDEMVTETCSSAGDKKAKCKKEITTTKEGDKTTVRVVRGCGLVAQDAEDGCSVSGDKETCFCGAEVCNAQMRLVPAMVTFLLSLALVPFLSIYW